MLLNLIYDICSGITLIKLPPHPPGANKLIISILSYRWVLAGHARKKWIFCKYRIEFMIVGLIKFTHSYSAPRWQITISIWSSAGMVFTYFPHDDVIKWKHFLRYWPFVRGIHQSQVDSPHKGQWYRALIFLMCSWTNGWAKNQDAGDFRCHCAHCDITIICWYSGHT